MESCYFCDAPAHTGLCEPVVTVKINISKDQCSWCSDHALYSIECSSWVDLACKIHLAEWFPTNTSGE